MKKNLATVAAVALVAAAGGCAWDQQHGTHEANGGSSGSSIPASFPRSARAARTQVGYCDDQDYCGIELVEDTVAGKCVLRPATVDKIVIVRRKEKGKPVVVSWYIPPSLQAIYSFQREDGVAFKKPQSEFDHGTRVSPAEFSWRDRMTDNTALYGYSITVTKTGGEKCIVDPILVNDW